MSQQNKVSRQENPLHIAARYGFTMRIRPQMSTLEQLNEPNKLGEVAMHIASVYNKIEFVRLLLARGADQTRRNILHQLPIHLACAGGHLSLLNTFLSTAEGKASLTSRDKSGNFCIHLAAAVEGSTQMLKKLAQLSNLNAENSDGETCLIVAAKLGNLRNVKTIIGYGANFRLSDTRGRTALHAAAAYGHTRVVEYLMSEKKRDITNEVTSLGESALILALKKKHEITAATIIIHGADCFIEDRWGKSAKDYASLPNLQVAAKLLQDVWNGDIWSSRYLTRCHLAETEAAAAAAVNDNSVSATANQEEVATVSEEEIEEEPEEPFDDQFQQNALIWESVFQPAMDEAVQVSFSSAQTGQEYTQFQTEPLDLSATSAANATSWSSTAPMAEEARNVNLTQVCVHNDYTPEPMIEDDIEIIPAVDSVAAYLHEPIVIDITDSDEETAISDDGNSDTTVELDLNTPRPVLEEDAVKLERQGTPAPWFNQVVDVIRWLEEDFPHQLE